jgi:hypothetical protein
MNCSPSSLEKNILSDIHCERRGETKREGGREGGRKEGGEEGGG